MDSAGSSSSARLSPRRSASPRKLASLQPSPSKISPSKSPKKSAQEAQEDHPDTPFCITNKIFVQESHERAIYSCAFNNYLPEDQNPVFATTAGRCINIYECPSASYEVTLLTSFLDKSEEEDYFTLSWCYDVVEEGKGLQPYMIAAAGSNAIIRIIRAFDGKLMNVLRGHGNSINEIRTNPGDSMIIASASADTTIRIWNIRQEYCLAILGGYNGHQDQILSVDWAACGTMIASCSMDHTIRLWKLNDGNFILEGNTLNAARKNDNDSGDPSTDVTAQNPTRTEDDDENIPFSTLADISRTQTRNQITHSAQIHFPRFIIDDLHADYVDCVRFKGNYCISKGSGAEKMIHLFKFGSFGESYEEPAWKKTFKADTCALKIAEKHLPGGDLWFVKMDTDPQCKWLACGNRVGEVYFYRINKNVSNVDPDFWLKIGKLPVRQVTFDPTGRILLAVGDDCSITRLDRLFEGEVAPKYELSFAPSISFPKQPQKSISDILTGRDSDADCGIDDSCDEDSEEDS